MKLHARAVVIGGGVVGVSTLYHLTMLGWSDVLLIERKELTSGSTWHAAGLLPLFNMSYSVGQLHKYSVGLYRRLAAETGQDVGFAAVGNIRLARTRDRWDEYMAYAGTAETIGVRVEVLTPAEVKELWPLCRTEDLIGAIRHPDDGYIQPADLTQALARAARERGATIARHTRVTGITRIPGGEWRVETDKGAVLCEHVVAATGNFARRTGAMVGLEVPVLPVEHQYIVTEPHPAIVERRREGLPEMGVLRESDNSWYMREENGGLLLGPYEKGAPACYLDGPAEDSEYELFQEDLERLMPYVETAIARVPAFGEVGIRKIYNGAIPYTPDGSPIVGPAPGLDNFWLNEGHSFGITAAGGAGWQLAHWIVAGEPTIDMMGVDPRRFGSHVRDGYLRVKNEEAYANVFTVHYPDEERPAGRPLKTAPCHERLAARGAVFGAVNGWERANWFAPPGYRLPGDDPGKPDADVLLRHNHAAPLADGRIVERWSFRRSNYFDHVGSEVLNTHEHAGLLDMTAFAKMEVSGPGARDWLDRILANRLPRTPGRIALCHLLTDEGGVRSEFTVHEWAPGRFYLVSAGALETHDHDVLRRLAPRDGSVTLRPLTEEIGVLVLAGPKSRAILERLTRTDLSSGAFPWLTGKWIAIGAAHAQAMRVNFVGELGWELHHPLPMQNALFDALMEAGEPVGLKPFGIRAMLSMAVEKSYRLIPRELSIEYSAWESGLDRFIALDKGAFIGRDSLVRLRETPPRWRFATLEVHAVTDCDARGNEPIHHQGILVGRATSGAYGWRVGKSLALAMLRPDLAVPGTRLTIRILGQDHEASVIPESPFDPENARLKG